MSGGQTAFLVIEGVVFAAWGFTMFRCLFHIRRKAEEVTGKVFSGPITFLSTVSAWFSDPQERFWVRLLAVLTALLFVIIGVSMIVLGPK